MTEITHIIAAFAASLILVSGCGFDSCFTCVKNSCQFTLLLTGSGFCQTKARYRPDMVAVAKSKEACLTFERIKLILATSTTTMKPRPIRLSIASPILPKPTHPSVEQVKPQQKQVQESMEPPSLAMVPVTPYRIQASILPPLVEQVQTSRGPNMIAQHHSLLSPMPTLSDGLQVKCPSGLGSNRKRRKASYSPTPPPEIVYTSIGSMGLMNWTLETTATSNISNGSCEPITSQPILHRYVALQCSIALHFQRMKKQKLNLSDISYLHLNPALPYENVCKDFLIRRKKCKNKVSTKTHFTQMPYVKHQHQFIQESDLFKGISIKLVCTGKREDEAVRMARLLCRQTFLMYEVKIQNFSFADLGFALLNPAHGYIDVCAALIYRHNFCKYVHKNQD